jgi:hypothetical protein
VSQPVYDDSEWNDEELRGLLARSANQNGWDEAEMESYDWYDEAFWRMIEKRRQEKGIPWEEAKKQLDQ